MAKDKDQDSFKYIFLTYSGHQRNNFIKLLSDYLASVFAFIFTRYTSLTPNQITAFSFLFGFVSAISILFGNIYLFALFYYLSFLFDYVDGKVASIRRMGSPFGQKIDIWTDRTTFLLVSISFSCFMYIHGMYFELSTFFAFAMIFMYADFIEISQERYNLITYGRESKDRVYVYAKGDWYRWYTSLKLWYPVRGLWPILIFIIAPLTGVYTITFLLGSFFILLQLLFVLRGWIFGRVVDS